MFRIVGYLEWWEDNHKDKSGQHLSIDIGNGRVVVSNLHTKTESVASENQGDTVEFGGAVVGREMEHSSIGNPNFPFLKTTV